MDYLKEFPDLYPEFDVGAMLPNMGSTEGFDTPFGRRNILDVLSSDDAEINNIEFKKTDTEDGFVKYEAVKRSKIPTKLFGIPEERKFPLDTKKHVKSAIHLFGHAAPDKRAKLAHRILARMRHYKMSVDDYISQNSKIREYMKESAGTDDMISFESMYMEFFGDDYEKSDDNNDKRIKSRKIPDRIRRAVKILEGKGYRVKYASPGYEDTRFEEDRNKDGVIYNKMVSTGKIVFEKDYKFADSPEGWMWKVLPSNNFKALYAKPYSYGKHLGNPEKAVNGWIDYCIHNLEVWAKALPTMGAENVDKHLNKETEEDDSFEPGPDTNISQLKDEIGRETEEEAPVFPNYSNESAKDNLIEQEFNGGINEMANETYTLKDSMEYISTYLEAVKVAKEYEDSLEDDELIEEGANIEYHKIMKEAKAKYRAAIKSFKRNYKSGQYEYAVSDLEEAKSAISSAMKSIESIKGGGGSFVFGLFVPTIRDFALGLITTATLGVAGPIVTIYQIVTRLTTLINDVKKTDDISINNFNLYRNGLLRNCRSMLSFIDKMQGKVRAKAGKNMKESYEDVDDEPVTLEETMDYIQAFLEEARVGADRSSDMSGTVGYTKGAEHYKPSSDSRHPQLKSAPWDSELAANLKGNAAMINKTEPTKDVFESEIEELADSIDGMRLSIYEAYDQGIIDEDTKEAFLESLDINNYELA